MEEIWQESIIKLFSNIFIVTFFQVEEEDAYPEKLDLAPEQGETVTASINIPPKASKARSGVNKSSIPAPPTPAMPRMKIDTSRVSAKAGGSSKWKVLKQKVFGNRRLLGNQTSGSSYEKV